MGSWIPRRSQPKSSAPFSSSSSVPSPSPSGSARLIGAALAHGFVVIAYPYGYGSFSGSHLNPAVSFGLFVAGVMNPGKMLAYWVAQLTGGIAGGALLCFLLGAESSLGATVLDEGVSPREGTAPRSRSDLHTGQRRSRCSLKRQGGEPGAGHRRLHAHLLHPDGGPLTGASLNPARTLGPALFTDTLNLFWIYLAGTFSGAAAAGLLHRVCRAFSQSGAGSA